jgi:hypothetical protein
MTATSIRNLPLDILKQITFLVDDPGTTMLISKQFLQVSEFFYTKLFKEYSVEGSALRALDYPQRAIAAIQTTPGFTIGRTTNPDGTINRGTTYQWLDLARVQHVYRAILSDARNIGGGDQTIITARLASTSLLPNASTSRRNIDPSRLNALANWIPWEKDYNLILWFYPISVPGSRSSALIAQAFWNDPEAAQMGEDLINSTANFTTFVHDMRVVPEHQTTAHSLAKKIRAYIGTNLVSFESQLIDYIEDANVIFREDPDERLHLLPDEIGSMKGLQSFLLCAHNIMTIPQSILTLPQLRELNISGCHLRSIPEEINQLTNLQALILCDNDLTTIPDTIVDLPNLSVLMLRGNRLTDVPPMYRLEELTYLSLQVNPVIEGPDFPPNAAHSYKIWLFSYQCLKDCVYGINNWGESYASNLLLRTFIIAPALIFTALLSVVEGICRGGIGLIAQSIYSFLPQGEVKNFFTRDLLPQTWGSFGFCFRFTIVALCLLVQNFYKSEVNLKETEKLVKSYIPFL